MPSVFFPSIESHVTYILQHFTPSAQHTRLGLRTPYLSPSFDDPKAGFSYTGNRYGEPERFSQEPYHAKEMKVMSAGMDSSAPPSQSLYDIVKPSEDMSLEPEVGDSATRPHRGNGPQQVQEGAFTIQQRRQQNDELARQEDWGRVDGGNWVTVFGFPASQIPYILLHFQNYGDIVRHYIPPGQCNWLNIQYQTSLQANKALSKNGKIIGDNLNLMVGVVESSDGVWRPSTQEVSKAYVNLGFPRPLNPPSQRQPSRSYQVDIFDSKRAPTKHNSLWSKFFEYVLGG